MSYSLDAIADNCYPNTTVLINKLDIRDEALLNEVEATLVTSKSVLWEQTPLLDTFDFADIDGDLLMIATIQSANGVTDLLRELLEKLL